MNAIGINRAIGFGFERRLDVEQLTEIQSFFREHGISQWSLECSPNALIDTESLLATGGVIAGSTIKLVGELNSLVELPAASHEVVEATSRDAPSFMAIVSPQLDVPELARPGIVSTIGQPPWRFYFALSDARPVAAAAMLIDGEGAWLGLAGTLPEYQNRGAQTALLLRRIQDAKAAGCRWVSAETSPETLKPNPSLRNMRRIGLRELYRRPWYRFREEGSRPSA
ncbi:MAG TPA: GNAT family N-acetyltransferase [Gemmatimonadaceae bacterium]